MLKLSVKVRTNSDEVGVDHMNTKFKKNHQRAITSNCSDFPTRGVQYIGFIIYEQVSFYFSCLHLLLDALTELYRTGHYSGVVGSLSA